MAKVKLDADNKKLLRQATAIEAASQIPSIIQAGKSFTESDKERLAALERRAALGTLGLTPAEEDVLRTNLLSPAQALATQQMMDQRALMAATGGATGGAQFGAAMARQEAEQRRLAEAQARIAEEDLKLAQQQRDEILALQRAEDQMKADRRAAILGGVAQTAGEYLGLRTELLRLKELADKNKNPNPQPPANDPLAIIKNYADMFLGGGRGQ